MFNTLNTEGIREEPNINLGDFLPKDAIIRPQNMICKRVLSPDGGKIIFDLKYEIQ